MEETEKNRDTWKRKYNMTTQDWKNSYFKELIGGKKVSTEEKSKILSEIKDATIKNNNGFLKELSKDKFLKTYPDSIYLLKNYYDSLIFSHKHISGNKLKTYHYYNFGKNKTWEEVLTADRNAMLMIYAPYLNSLSNKELSNIAESFNISINDLNDTIIKYKKDFSDSEKDKKSLKASQKYDLEILEQIINDISINNLTEQELETKYKLNGETLNDYLEQLKEFDIKAYNQIIEKIKLNNEKYIIEMNDLIQILYKYIANGIELEDRKIPFTMLDYYCISNKNIQKISEYINNKDYAQSVKQFKSRIMQFIVTNKNVGPFESPESFAGKKISLIVKDNKVDFDEKTSSEIINILKDNDIPTNYQIVYTAARRYARGEEILPIKTNTKKNVKVRINK